LKTWVYLFVLPKLAEVSIKLVVCVLANGAGVENNNVSKTILNRNVASALEKAR
jgi:hypothetical protein